VIPSVCLPAVATHPDWATTLKSAVPPAIFPAVAEARSAPGDKAALLALRETCKDLGPSAGDADLAIEVAKYLLADHDLYQRALRSVGISG
jgi:hypothetical protein